MDQYFPKDEQFKGILQYLNVNNLSLGGGLSVQPPGRWPMTTMKGPGTDGCHLIQPHTSEWYDLHNPNEPLCLCKH